MALGEVIADPDREVTAVRLKVADLDAVVARSNLEAGAFPTAILPRPVVFFGLMRIANCSIFLTCRIEGLSVVTKCGVESARRIERQRAEPRAVFRNRWY